MLTSLTSRNNVRLLGASGAPVMFAHGFGCDQAMWRYVVPYFEDQHRVILFDHVGSGRSDLRAWSAAKYASLQGYADDIVDILDELSLNEPVHLVGHSVSAMIGALAAIKRPDLFSSLLMVCPSPRYLNDEAYQGGFDPADIDEMLETLDSNYLGWSSAMAPAIMGNSDRPELAQELEASFCRNDPAIARHFARVTFMGDNRDDLPKIETKTLVLQCTDDAIAGESVGLYTHRNVRESAYKLMQATGHCPNLSAPEETARAILEFISANGG